MFPALHFGSGQFDFGSEANSWEHLSLAQLSEHLETLRKSLKKAANYPWDSGHYYLEDSCGRPAMQFLVDQTGLHFWDVTGTVSILSLTEDQWEKDRSGCVQVIREALEKIKEDYKRCNECGKWVKKGHRYSFAGFVCEDCYDPERYLPPDTRGD